ncbi:hypothetical protein TNIN_180481 [Trichonephila inaurata madagascariensis]|uniref:Uncharacterized protein n=1 Tax=Trichonephila inaurata madagascariensis TaxID=2747483 RepID=A0A8X7CTK0_9ARAC|nr:hypothetical protein TNIN_180481 [Trichonephila inaurata madagascariensis]
MDIQSFETFRFSRKRKLQVQWTQFSRPRHSMVFQMIGAVSRWTLRTLQVRKVPKCILAPPVVSWRTRKAGNGILPRPRGGGCSSPFFRRGSTLRRRLESKVVALHSSRRSCLSACGNLATTSCRCRAAVGDRHCFSVEVLHYCPVASWCTRKEQRQKKSTFP